jgi:hypothetical protein
MITVAVGVCFLVLVEAIYAFVALSDYRAAQCQWTIKAQIRRRMAIISAAVGVSLIVWQRFLSK